MDQDVTLTMPEEAPARVKFGPGPDDSVPISWADTMLTELHRINPVMFGKLALKAMRAVKGGQ